MRRHFRESLSAVIVLHCAAAACSAAGYIATDLGCLDFPCADGFLWPRPWAINNRGQIAGSGARAYVWDAGVWHPLPDFGECAAALGINDAGVAVGLVCRTPSTNPSITGIYAARWRDGKLDILPSRWWWSYSADDINERGDVLGYDMDWNEPIVWIDNQPYFVLPNHSAVRYQSGRAINDHGDIAGHSCLIDTEGVDIDICRAWFLPAAADEPIELAPAGLYRSSVAPDVNNLREVVGTIVVDRSTRWAFVWDGALHELETLAGATRTAARAINNESVIVGTAQTGGDPRDVRAVLWIDRQVVDLQSSLPDDSDWHVTDVFDINDWGQIIGAGIHAGEYHGVLLTPVLSLPGWAHWVDCLEGPALLADEGCGALDLDADGTVDLADFARLQLGFGSLVGP